MQFSKTVVWTIVICLALPILLFAKIETETVELNFVSPDELIEALSLRKDPSGCFSFQYENNRVQVRLNQALNWLSLTGEPEYIAILTELIEQFDVAPRQFLIEAKIVEIDNQKSREVGLDWQNVLDNVHFQNRIGWEKTKQKQEYKGEYSTSPRTSEDERTTDRYSSAVTQNLNLGEFLKLIDESGAGKTTNVPHIVTTNNKQGTIFDGQKIKYVAQLSSYSNIYQTEELASGLMLAVTPSLGKSGYLKMIVNAKLTYLDYHNQFPIESGQSLENMVIMKDGESLVLGGFKRTEKYKAKKKVPILGTILPFLFSKHYDVENVKDVLIILTPTVIDLNLPEVPEIP